MKSLASLLALFSLLCLPSCVDLGSSYSSASYGRSYGSGYDYDEYGYGSGYGTRSYTRPYYGGSYYGSSDYHSSHDHGSSSRSSSSKRSSDEKIRLVRGSDGDHDTRPSGYHSKDWYKSRGYDLHKYTYKDEDGDVKHKAHGNDKKHR
jgi:hypothetical protein